MLKRILEDLGTGIVFIAAAIFAGISEADLAIRGFFKKVRKAL